MEELDVYTCMTNHLPAILLDCIKRYLEIESNEQLRFTYEIFREVGVEMYEFDELIELPSPERFIREVMFRRVLDSHSSLGDIEFGVYSGRKLVVEHHAYPLIVYWKDEKVKVK